MHYLKTNDLAKLFRTMHDKNPSHQLVALTAFFTGARISQVLRLRGEDIFETDGRMVVKIHAAKRGLDRVHNLHFDTDAAFDMSPLIALAKMRPTAKLWGGLTRQYFNLALKKYCTASGLHTDYGHSHIFRHSVAMQIWDATQRLGTISHFLGHRSPSSALFYLSEVDGQSAQKAVDSLVLA